MTRLPMHEWCIILLFCLILLTLAGFALGRPRTQAVPTIASSVSSVAVLQVKIEGQVTKPGWYRLPLNATLKQLLEQAGPLPSADLSQLNWRRRLRNDQVVHIPERRPITIQITGAVLVPGALQILSGTRYCELADQLQVEPTADLRALRKKKSFVQEGDCVTVPTKKRERKKASDDRLLMLCFHLLWFCDR